MKIGVDASCWSNKRGFGRFTRELLNAMVAVDQKNEYLFFADQDTASSGEFPDKVQMITAKTDMAPTKAASASGRRSIKDLWAMNRLVRGHDMEIFFFPAVYSYFPINTKAKVVVTLHDIIAEQFPELVFPDKKLHLFWKIKQYLANKQADLILTVSEYSKEQITNYFKMKDSRVKAISEAPDKIFGILPHGDEMSQVLQKFQLNDKTRFMLYVGGLSPHKNLGTLIDVHAELIKEEKFSDVKLVLVGDYEGDSFYSNYEVLKEQINGLGLQDKVIFTGFISDSELAYLYNAATFLVFPSLQEGFGLPAIEAMASGTPVAASNAGSLPEIVGEAGKFYDPNSHQEMLETFQNLFSDDALREKMSQEGIVWAKNFTWEKAARDTLLIFDELVKG